MCFGGNSTPQPTPPPPAPAPANPTAAVTQTAPKTTTSSNDSLNAQRIGAAALRIDQTQNNSSGSSGLNIPT